MLNPPRVGPNLKRDINGVYTGLPSFPPKKQLTFENQHFRAYSGVQAGEFACRRASNKAASPSLLRFGDPP